MEPQNSKAFSGGSIDNWYAPNITSDPAQGIGRWSEGDLVQYFKTGTDPRKGRRRRTHGAGGARQSGPSFRQRPPGDRQPTSSRSRPSPATRPTGLSGEVGPHASGENVYIQHCSFCHQLDGRGRPGAVPALAGNGAVKAKGPEDVIRVILGGHLATGTFAPMPPVGAG